MTMSRSEKEQIKNMLRGYKRITKSMLKMIESYGLIVSGCGKHYKIKREDQLGGFVTFAKTPSDTRAGLNVSVEIIRLIEL